MFQVRRATESLLYFCQRVREFILKNYNQTVIIKNSVDDLVTQSFKGKLPLTWFEK